MKDFPDCILMQIFKWLTVPQLVTCSQICHQWKRVTYDSELWIDVDLCPFRWKLDEQSIIRLVNTRFKPCLRKLNLTSFSLTPKLFSELSIHCSRLRSLILENVNFIGFSTEDEDAYKFPGELHHLDIRYSSGDPAAYELITKNLNSLRSIGITNSLLSQVNNVEVIRSLKNIHVLDFSHCSALHDATLLLLGTFCTNLVSLSLSHCNNVKGQNLSLIVNSCKNLRALSFNGTSLDDSSLQQCNWQCVRLEELDISWCRSITEQGMISVLPSLKDLTYLRLCSCGFGHAITDNVLGKLNGHQKLKFLDVSYSREITNYGVSKVISALVSLKQIRISSCRKLTPNLLNSITTNNGVLVIPSFPEHSLSNNRFDLNHEDTSLCTASGTNKLMISVSQSSLKLRRYTLDHILQTH